VDCYSEPATAWNTAVGYYPGDEWVDWIGLSCYGPQEPGDPWELLTQALDATYPSMAAISTNKPMALLEFAVVDDAPTGSKAAWTTDALTNLATARWPRIKAAAWWHETFGPSDLSIDSSPAALAAYQAGVATPQFRTRPRWRWIAQ
jgi:hypothetical protein